MPWPTLVTPSPANFLDHFDGSLDTSKWTALTSGTGAVTVTDSYLRMVAPAASAAAVYYNTKLDKTKSQLWQVCWAQQGIGGSGEGPIDLMLMNGGSAPAADTKANINAKTLVRSIWADIGVRANEVIYYDSGGTKQRWDPTTPAWASAFQVARSPLQDDDYYITVLELDGPNARWRVMGLGQAFATAGTYAFDQGWRLFYLSDWVNWSATRSNTDVWLTLGSPFTDLTGSTVETRVEWVRYAEAPAGNSVIDAFLASKEGVAGVADHRIKHVYSFDGLSFVPQDRTTWALNLGAGGTVDDGELQRPRAVWDGASTDWLFYVGNDGTATGNTICVASATHAVPQNNTWTKYASNPILTFGAGGADDETSLMSPAVVYDLDDTDSSKRWKMLYIGFRASDGKSQIMYATAPGPTGPWTKQGTVLALGSGGSYDEGSLWDPVIVRHAGQWEVWYEAHDATDQITLRRATGPSLGSLTKDTADYTMALASAKQALTANLTSAPGRTVTVGSTTGFVKDASVVLSQSNVKEDYAFSKIRKIVSGTVLELYHGLTGFTTATPAKIWQRDGGKNRSPRVIVKVGDEWWFYTTFWDPWSFASDDASYGALDEAMYLGKHSGAGPADAIAAIVHEANPVAWRGFNQDQRSHENMTLVDGPFTERAGWFVFDKATPSVRTGIQDPYTFSHAGAAADVNGVIVAVVHGTSSTDHVVAVTYGGAALTRKQTNVDTATELGRADLWFLGDKSLILDGTQTVSVDLSSATTDDIHIVCMTLVGAGDLEVIDNDGIDENVANPTVTMNKAGRFALSFGALYGGGAAPGGTIQTGCQRVASNDFGAFYSDVLREDSPEPSDQAIGFSTLTSDDVAFAAIAVAARTSDPITHRRRRGRTLTRM